MALNCELSKSFLSSAGDSAGCVLQRVMLTGNNRLVWASTALSLSDWDLGTLSGSVPG